MFILMLGEPNKLTHQQFDNNQFLVKNQQVCVQSLISPIGVYFVLRGTGMTAEGESKGGRATSGLFAIIGIILLFGGVIAYFYEEVKDGIWIPSYQWLGILLMALGIASIIAEAVLHFYARKKKTTPTLP
jgi:hypothetical protein